METRRYQSLFVATVKLSIFRWKHGDIRVFFEATVIEKYQFLDGNTGISEFFFKATVIEKYKFLDENMGISEFFLKLQ